MNWNDIVPESTVNVMPIIIVKTDKQVDGKVVYTMMNAIGGKTFFDFTCDGDLAVVINNAE